MLFCTLIDDRPKNTDDNMANKDLNRLKLLLVEKKKTGKWLAEQLGKDQTTISKWCTNCNQPDVESLIKYLDYYRLSFQIL